MFKSVLYKEWIKTKWYVIGICVVSILLHAYMFMKLGRSIRFAGMVHLWDVIINKDQFIFREIKLFPLISGIVLGIAQFVPEIYQKRLKLALHLPLPSFRIISWNVLYGAITLALVYVISIAILITYIRLYFAIEFVESAFLTILPWYLAGIVSYFLVAWICLEPRWNRRIINTIISIPILCTYMITALPAAYSSCVILILSIAIVVMFFVYISVIRFKDGK